MHAALSAIERRLVQRLGEVGAVALIVQALNALGGALAADGLDALLGHASSATRSSSRNGTLLSELKSRRAMPFDGSSPRMRFAALLGSPTTRLSFAMSHVLVSPPSGNPASIATALTVSHFAKLKRV